jgi:hypothetical protein
MCQWLWEGFGGLRLDATARVTKIDMGIQIENRSFDFGATARDAPTWLDFLPLDPSPCMLHPPFLPAALHLPPDPYLKCQIEAETPNRWPN